MPENKYLTEERYNLVNKKFKIASAVVLILGLLIGGGLIAFAVAKYQDDSSQVSLKAAAAVSEAKEKLNQVEAQMESLEAEYAAKEQECNSLWGGRDNSWGICKQEASTIKDKIQDLERERSALLKDSDIEAQQRLFDGKTVPVKWLALAALGGIVVLVGMGISFKLWFVTKGRAIMAHGVQTAMPVAKETIKEITPAVADAYGKVAEKVAKGVKKGIKK